MLKLVGHPGTPRVLHQWPEQLQHGVQVENLKMGWCKLGKVEGAAAVADLIMFNTTLNTLDVRGNSFEDNGAILISRALKEHGNDHLQVGAASHTAGV